MVYQYPFDYLSCQSCTAKIHCDDCTAQLHQRLTKNAGLTYVDIDMAAKRMCIRTDDSLDEDELLDLLEDAGVFAG